MSDGPETKLIRTDACGAGAVFDPDFRAVFRSSPRPQLIIAADPPKFTMVAVNAAHARAFQTTPEALIGWGVLEVFGADLEPNVAAFVEAIRLSLERVIATGRADQMAIREYPVPTTDGGSQDERYWSAINAPVKDAGGRITHIISAVQDVTGEVYERRSEEARRLLMREVDHRARNALSIVQSFVRLTAAKSVEDFRRVLDGRVAALGRAQTSLAARRWEGASLRHVVEGELKSLATPEQFSLQGPNVLLKPEDVQAMSMAIHELATNAAKYGALSSKGGRLAVRWSRAPKGALHLTWVEEAAAPIEPPAEQSFGSQLITQMARQMRGEVRYDWRATGLIVAFDLQGAS